MNKKEKVLKVVACIPTGKVSTYGRVAQAAGVQNPRYVGYVLHRNSDPRTFPCHRVVFANGSLSNRYVFGGKRAQKKKLVKEGVILNRDKVDIALCLWKQSES